MSAPLHIDVERDGFRAIVRCFGEIDHSTADPVTQTVGEVLAGDAAELVLDLSEVGFVDSTGLRAVILSATSAEAVGIRFTVLPSAPVERLLEMAAVRDIVQGRT